MILKHNVFHIFNKNSIKKKQRTSENEKIKHHNNKKIILKPITKKKNNNKKTQYLFYLFLSGGIILTIYVLKKPKTTEQQIKSKNDFLNQNQNLENFLAQENINQVSKNIFDIVTFAIKKDNEHIKDYFNYSNIIQEKEYIDEEENLYNIKLFLPNKIFFTKYKNLFKELSKIFLKNKNNIDNNVLIVDKNNRIFKLKNSQFNNYYIDTSNQMITVKDNFDNNIIGIFEIKDVEEKSNGSYIISFPINENLEIEIHYDINQKIYKIEYSFLSSTKLKDFFLEKNLTNKQWELFYYNNEYKNIPITLNSLRSFQYLENQLKTLFI